MPSIVPEADESDESESSPGDEGDPSDSDGEVDFDYTERELDGRSLSLHTRWLLVFSAVFVSLLWSCGEGLGILGILAAS